MPPGTTGRGFSSAATMRFSENQGELSVRPFIELFFDDEIQLLGGIMEGERLQVVIAQPYIDGVHPEWSELKAELIRQNLRDPAPRALGGNFLLDHDLLGEVDLFDLHPNNVIRDVTGWLHPIDAHFYLADRATRIAAMKSLGLLEE